MTIYFDNNATTHLDPIVAKLMYELNLQGISNPASQHRAGRDALHLLEEAKTTILDSVHASTDSMNSPQIVLTSGGTESNNLALNSLYAQQPGLAIVGGTDHPSVIEAAKFLGEQGGNFRVLPVDEHGACDLNVLSDWILDAKNRNQPVSFVSVMLGNNETGILQDLPKISAICAAQDVPVHSDVVQAIGKIPVDMNALGLSALTLTAHKIHGPVGVGALIARPNVKLEPMVIGGGQQLGVRAGTEAVVPAVGLATCLTQILHSLENGEYQKLEILRDNFEKQMCSACDAVVIGEHAKRLPHTSNLSFPGVDRQALQMSLDLKGLACSTGSACSSGSGRPSGSLVAMGIDDEIVRGSLRFSFSRFTSESEIENGISIISEAVSRCRQAV